MPPKPSKKSKRGAKSSQDINQIVKTAVTAAMKAVNPVVAPKGNTFLGDVGAFAGNGISKIFGLGAYKISRNSLFNAQTGSQVPFMHSTSESVIFRHREYIGEVTSSTAFTTSTYPVNPGMPGTFPYLSTIASCFQEYRFRGLVFEFKSTGADALVNGTNTSLGTVGLVAQYRADASTLTTKVEFLNEMWSTSCKTSDCTILPVECAPKENPMSIQYVRTGPATGDVKNYDLCSLTVATNGSPGSNVVGELWASYEIELLKPTVTPTGGVLAADHFTRSATTGNSGFGLIQTGVLLSGIGCTVNSNSISFPTNVTGRFLVTVFHVGTSAVLAYPVPTVTNATLLPTFLGSLNYIVAPASGTTSGQVSFSVVVSIPGGTGLVPVLTWAPTSMPTASSIDVSIVEVPDSYA